ncbi:MAG: hypothetical protein WA989_03775 [Henriciella sp.]
MDRLFSEVFISNVAKCLSEQLSVEPSCDGDALPARDRLSLSAQAAIGRDRAVLHAVCEEGPTRRRIWSETRVLPSRGAPPLDDESILQLANEAVDIVGDLLWREDIVETDPTALALMASRWIFSTDRREQDRADRLLAKAFEADAPGLFLS